MAITLGETFAEAVGDKAGVRRFASGLYPLDEALVEVALDLSGRPFVAWNVPLPESLPLGNPPFDPQLAEHAVSSFATNAEITLHVSLRAGRNTHHIVEATFKGSGPVPARRGAHRRRRGESVDQGTLMTFPGGGRVHARRRSIAGASTTGSATSTRPTRR